MSWPLSQDYNEAIQDPRSSFNDAELKTGEAVGNALGIPMPRSGNFADVYEVRCPSGSRWAVKCFTREVHGLRERYAEISKYLHRINLPFMVDFQYLEQGIRVRNQWYPILKMQWVEGFVLNEFVRNNLDKKPILHSLGQIWLRMGRRLREARLAHCDLQHGNVLFVPGSSAQMLAVKLIDYDGMCVPSLVNKKSGELGHPAYQHPDRLRTGIYNQEVDRFSLLSIAAALRCLTIGGRALWERYDNGDNLLFQQKDLHAPAESPLFRELLTIGDPQAQMLVNELYRACQGPLAAVPLLTDLIPKEKPAGKATTIAAHPGATTSEMDWDFSDSEPSTSILRGRRASRGMPLWVWGALGAAAALLLSVGVGAGLFLHHTSGPKEATSIAQESLAPNASKTGPKPQLLNGELAMPVKPDAPAPKTELSAEKPAEKVVSDLAVIWQIPVDPDGDCKFQNAGGKLTITVPGKDHDLGAERGRMNAPRLLCDMEGDFTAQMRVSGDFQPSTDSTVTGKVPVVGAGLVLLLDEKNYLRLERFGLYRGQKFNSFGNWELRRNARPAIAQGSRQLIGNETYLRMERRGDTMLGSVSADGLNWMKLQSINLVLPPKVQFGVDVITTSSRPFAASFDQFQLKKGQGEMVRIDWPSLPAAVPVVVKPTPPPPPKPRPRPRNERLEAKCRSLEESLANLPAKSKDKFRLLTRKALLLVDRAATEEDFDSGKRLLEIARSSAAKADASTLLLKIVNQKTKQFTAIREEFEAIQGQADKFNTDPNDPDANLAMGRFRCFIRNDWDAGLPLLVNGSDKTLSDLAQKDWVDPAEASDRAALGDAWWERAEKSTGKEQVACRRRAYYWYLDCVEELDTRSQLRINARLRKLLTQLSEGNNAFPDLDIGVAIPIRRAGTPVLHFTQHQRIATRQLYRGPIDIHVTALLPNNHIRITFLNGGEVSLYPKDARTAEVKYYGHHDADPDRDRDSTEPTTRSAPLLPNAPQQIRILATENKFTLWINNKRVLSQSWSPSFTSFASSPVRVWSDDGVVDLVSLVVKRVRSGNP